MGKGFHFRTTTPKHYFIQSGYHTLATHNTHNQFLSLLLDVGIIGLGLFLLFLWLTFRHAWYLEKHSLNMMTSSIGAGGTYMIFSFVCLLIFAHNIEKNINTMSIYMIYFAIINLFFSLEKKKASQLLIASLKYQNVLQETNPLRKTYAF